MSFPRESLYFGVVVSLLTFWFGTWLKKKLGWAILNPILVSVTMIIFLLKLLSIDYPAYNEGAKYISYLLTPATVCLAIPLIQAAVSFASESGGRSCGHFFRGYCQRSKHFCTVPAV